MANAEMTCSNGKAAISGSAEIVGLAVNGTPVDVQGGVGEPGRNVDTFGLTTDNPNLAEPPPTLLGGGNIQYHRCK